MINIQIIIQISHSPFFFYSFYFSLFLFFIAKILLLCDYSVATRSNTSHLSMKKLDRSELLPLLEAGASWEVSAFASQIYLPSSSGSPCPVFLFPNIPTSLFQCFLYSMPHCNLYQFQSHSTHIYNFFLIISVPL